MNLDSARQLKTQLLEQQVAPLANMPAKATRLAMAARRVAAANEIPRTIALGITRAGPDDYRLAVRIQNQALSQGEELERIRVSANGEVDIRFVGRLVKRADWNRSRQRPLLIGVSIGHYNITAGTLGCFVRSRTGARATAIVSNNHVLADENNGRRGDAIIQPGRYDGGARGADTVATLERFVRLQDARPNIVDCAMGTLRRGITFDGSTLRDLGRVTGVAPDPEVVSEVAKVGRTTGVTHGRVTAFEMDNVVVGYDRGNLRFDNQIEIEGAGTDPFSQGGDSGSLIVTPAGRAVALLFAGGDQGGSNGKGLTYGNPFQSVLDALRADLIVS